MNSITRAALRRNNEGASSSCRTHFLDQSTIADELGADGPLTSGGKLVFRLTRRTATTCNRLAELAGLGSQET